MSSASTRDYQFLIRTIKPGDTIENVWQLVPGLSVGYQDSRTSEITLTDRRGLVIQGFRGCVNGISIKFIWNASWEDLRTDAAAHLEVPSDATWEYADSLFKAIMHQGEYAEGGAWLYGDSFVYVGLEDGLALISVGSSSAAKEAIEFIDSQGLLDDRDRIAMRALESRQAESRPAVPALVQLGTASLEPPPVQNQTSKIYVQLASKEFHPANLVSGDIGDRIDFVFYFQTALDKDIRAFKGDVIFKDLFDEFILRVTLTHEGGLATYEVAEWTGGIQYNQFLPEHQRLRLIEPKDLSVSFDLHAAVYTDGTRESFSVAGS